MDTTRLNKLFQQIDGHTFEVRYWDGSVFRRGTGEVPEFSVVLHARPVMHKLIADPSLYLGEAYMDGNLDLEGDLDAVTEALNQLLIKARSRLSGKLLDLVSLSIRAMSDINRQKQNIHTHYDLGNDFFSLWLDKTMSYSCAYFTEEGDSLEQAQLRKIDHILKKLQLNKDMRLLEIGCGWGWLSLKAAREYGARVLGITLSEEQYAKVKERVREAGLEGRVEVRLQNYLELEERDAFDRVVSVGMFEHVGPNHIPHYFEKVNDVLKPGGVSLLHTITKADEAEANSWLKAYIFPGGYIPSFEEIIRNLRASRFPVLHVESLRRHYAKTLDIWFENFSQDSVLDIVRAKFGDRFIRMWSLYLRMAASFFRIGDLDLHQFVFTKDVNNSLPMTMETVYH